MLKDDWWDFGEFSGDFGNELALKNIECAYCSTTGNWEETYHVSKKQPNGNKTLNFDTYKCGNCANYIQIFWSASTDPPGPYRQIGIHASRVQPWPLGGWKGEDYWPDTAKRYWKQAHNALRRGDDDSAVVMARSAVQAIIRNKGGSGKDLYSEIDDLVAKHVIPNIVGSMAHEVRTLAKPSAHPAEDDDEVNHLDAKDIVEFLDVLLEYVYDLPKKINSFRERNDKPPLNEDGSDPSTK